MYYNASVFYNRHKLYAIIFLRLLWLTDYFYLLWRIVRKQLHIVPYTIATKKLFQKSFTITSFIIKWPLRKFSLISFIRSKSSLLLDCPIVTRLIYWMKKKKYQFIRSYGFLFFTISPYLNPKNLNVVTDWLFHNVDNMQIITLLAWFHNTDVIVQYGS